MAATIDSTVAPELDRYFLGQREADLGMYYMYSPCEALPELTSDELARMDSSWTPPVAYGVEDHPVATAQAGLVSFNRFKVTGDERFMLCAKAAADRLLALQHDDGSWRYSFDFIDLSAGWTSAMAQGQAISLLTRIYQMTSDVEYLNGAKAGAKYMLTPTDEGGTLGAYEDGTPFLEEYPGSLVSPNTLNGSIFALWGLRDLGLVTHASDLLALFGSLASGIAQHLDEYVAEDWSYYSLRADQTHLADDKYHRVHIVQARIMAALTNDEEWSKTAHLWEKQYFIRVNRTPFIAWRRDLMRRARVVASRFRERATTSAGPIAGPPLTTSGLSDRTVCLVHRGRLERATRLRREIRALETAGATVVVFTPHGADEHALSDSRVIVANPVQPLDSSNARLWPVRVLSNVARNLLRPIHMRNQVERQLVTVVEDRQVDVLWIIDWPMLSRYGRVAQRLRIPVVYETLDLVQEQSDSVKSVLAARKAEREAIGNVCGFITAGKGYAEYYASNYGRRPLVIDNSMDEHVSLVRHTGIPIRLVFLGALTRNRNLEELVEAMATAGPQLTLTLQGEDRLDGRLQAKIDELGLGESVRIDDPVAPEQLLQAAAQYDVGVVSLEPATLNERLASPQKLLTYLAAGLGVIASDLPGIRAIVGAHQLGPLVLGHGAADWAEGLKRLSDLGESGIDELKARSLEAHFDYSWQTQKADFLAEFSSAVALGRSDG